MSETIRLDDMLPGTFWCDREEGFEHQYSNFQVANGESIVVIDKDGIFRAKVEATDANSIEFLRILETAIAKRITGIEVTKV